MSGPISERLDYCKLNDQFFEEYCQMDSDPEVMKFYTSRAWGTREDALKHFGRFKAYSEMFPLLGGFFAFTKDTKEFVGLGVLVHLELNPENKSYEVGYRLPTRFWGKGFATEIAKALIDYGFHTLGFNEILGTTNPKNLVSERVLMKCGLERIGTTPHYGGSNLFRITKTSK